MAAWTQETCEGDQSPFVENKKAERGSCVISFILDKVLYNTVNYERPKIYKTKATFKF